MLEGYNTFEKQADACQTRLAALKIGFQQLRVAHIPQDRSPPWVLWTKGVFSRYIYRGMPRSRYDTTLERVADIRFVLITFEDAEGTFINVSQASGLAHAQAYTEAACHGSDTFIRAASKPQSHHEGGEFLNERGHGITAIDTENRQLRVTCKWSHQLLKKHQGRLRQMNAHLHASTQQVNHDIYSTGQI